LVQSSRSEKIEGGSRSCRTQSAETLDWRDSSALEKAGTAVPMSLARALYYMDYTFPSTQGRSFSASNREYMVSPTTFCSHSLGKFACSLLQFSSAGHPLSPTNSSSSLNLSLFYVYSYREKGRKQQEQRIKGVSYRQANRGNDIVIEGSEARQGSNLLLVNFRISDEDLQGKGVESKGELTPRGSRSGSDVHTSSKPRH